MRKFESVEGPHRTYWFYVCNPTPWPITCELNLQGSGEIQFLGDRPPGDGDSKLLKIELEPYDTVGAVIANETDSSAANTLMIESYSATVDDSLIDKLLRQLDDVQAKISLAEHPDKWDVVSNSDFEQPLSD